MNTDTVIYPHRGKIKPVPYRNNIYSVECITTACYVSYTTPPTANPRFNIEMMHFREIGGIWYCRYCAQAHDLTSRRDVS